LLLAIEDAVPAAEFTLFTGDRSASNLGLYRRADYELAREDRVADTLTLVHLTKTRG
jgi:hypothetical protein